MTFVLLRRRFGEMWRYHSRDDRYLPLHHKLSILPKVEANAIVLEHKYLKSLQKFNERDLNLIMEERKF